MKAIERLTEAYAAAQAGRHEEALNEYIWFHEHALAEERSLRGVRLSFALAYWKELGEMYSPAMEALLALRDRKVAILAAGVESWELFNDVSALNDSLGNARNTYDLLSTSTTEVPPSPTVASVSPCLRSSPAKTSSWPDASWATPTK